MLWSGIAALTLRLPRMSGFVLNDALRRGSAGGRTPGCETERIVVRFADSGDSAFNIYFFKWWR